MNYRVQQTLERFGTHFILIIYSILPLFPVIVVALNSLKPRTQIFR